MVVENKEKIVKEKIVKFNRLIKHKYIYILNCKH